MLKIRKRGKAFHVDFILGRKHVVRGSLGTQNRAAAMSRIYRLDIALSQGSQSPLWPELSRVIPPGTFTRFAKHAGVKEKYTQTWREFLEFYVSHRKLQVKPNTLESYLRTVKEFDRFVNEKQIEMLRDLQDEAVIDEFKAWRADRIKPIRRRKPREDCTLRLAINHLHQMFKFAKDRELIEKNPVRFMAVPWNSSRSEKQPFTGEDMLAMRQHAEDDWFLFVLLKCTGFRRSDVASLVWKEVHFDRGEAGEIEKVCKKNGVRVILPLSEELRRALEAEYLCRNPLPTEPVLLSEPMSLNRNATPGLFDHKLEFAVGPLSESQLRRRERQIYRRVRALGKRAGVANPHPHGFRHTFVIDSMVRGASLPLVARMTGDTEETISNYYLPFVQELRDRLHFILNSGVGLEELAVAASQRRHLRKQLAA